MSRAPCQPITTTGAMVRRRSHPSSEGFPPGADARATLLDKAAIYDIQGLRIRQEPGSCGSRDGCRSHFHLPLQEAQHLHPRVLGRLRTIALGVAEIEEGVAGALVAMELVRLAEAGELGIDPVDIGGRRIRVFQAKESDDGTGDLIGELEG